MSIEQTISGINSNIPDEYVEERTRVGVLFGEKLTDNSIKEIKDDSLEEYEATIVRCMGEILQDHGPQPYVTFQGIFASLLGQEIGSVFFAFLLKSLDKSNEFVFKNLGFDRCNVAILGLDSHLHPAPRTDRQEEELSASTPIVGNFPDILQGHVIIEETLKQLRLIDKEFRLKTVCNTILQNGIAKETDSVEDLDKSTMECIRVLVGAGLVTLDGRYEDGHHKCLLESEEDVRTRLKSLINEMEKTLVHG